MNSDHSVVCEIASRYCISDSFVDHDGYSISFKGFLPAVPLHRIGAPAPALPGPEKWLIEWLVQKAYKVSMWSARKQQRASRRRRGSSQKDTWGSCRGSYLPKSGSYNSPKKKGALESIRMTDRWQESSSTSAHTWKPGSQMKWFRKLIRRRIPP